MASQPIGSSEYDNDDVEEVFDPRGGISAWRIKDPLSPADQVKYLDEVCEAIRKEKLHFLQTPWALKSIEDFIKDPVIKAEVLARIEITEQAWLDLKIGNLSQAKYNSLVKGNARYLVELMLDSKADIFNRYERQRFIKNSLMAGACEIERAQAALDISSINAIEENLRLSSTTICQLAKEINAIRAEIRTKYDKLIESHVPLVISLVQKKINPRHHFDDIVAGGIQGLIISVENFNPKAGVQFSTYASNWILQCALAEFKKMMNLIRVPDEMISSQRRIDKAILELQQQGVSEPSHKEIGSRVDMSADEVARVRDLRSTVVSLEIVLDDGSQRGKQKLLRDIIADDGFTIRPGIPVEQDLLKEMFAKLPLLYNLRQIQYIKAFCRIEVDENGSPRVVDSPIVNRENFRKHWGFSHQIANSFGRRALTVIGSVAHLQWVSHSEILNVVKSRISPQALEILLNICREQPKSLNELASSPFITSKLARGMDVSANNAKGQEYMVSLLRELGRDLVWTTSSYMAWSKLSAQEKKESLGVEYDSEAGMLFLKYFENFHPGFDEFVNSNRSFLRRQGCHYSAARVREAVESLGTEIFRRVRPYQP